MLVILYRWEKKYIVYKYEKNKLTTMHIRSQTNRRPLHTLTGDAFPCTCGSKCLFEWIASPALLCASNLQRHTRSPPGVPYFCFAFRFTWRAFLWRRGPLLDLLIFSKHTFLHLLRSKSLLSNLNASLEITQQRTMLL